MRLLNTLFRADLYVRISTDKIEVRNVLTGRSSAQVADPPFTTERLLVGQFLVADALLKRVVMEAVGRSPFLSKRFLMHQVEKAEGGLSQVEERVLLELAAGSGAKRIEVWLGRTLSDAEVSERLTRQSSGRDETL
jgi:rod shape-determining protein MreB